MVISPEFEDVLEYLEPIRDLLADDAISEVMINPDLSVFVEERGLKRPAECWRRLTKEGVAAAVKRIARAEEAEPGHHNAIVNVRFGDRTSRVCIAGPPVTSGGYAIAIRKFRPVPFTAEELIASGALPEAVYEALARAVTNGENILVSGGLGSGKTTLLNVLARAIPPSERVCLLEDPPEIHMDHASKVSLKAADGYDFAVILKKGVLRLSADRVILGEVRGEEAFDLLRALNLGLRGSFATIHADNAEEALYTLANLATSNKPNLNPTFIRDQAARAIDYVAHMERGRDGVRRVRELVRVRRYDANEHRFVFESLYSDRADPK